MIKDEFGNLDPSGEGERDVFNPLSEVISSNNDKFMAIG